jgi:hypothetical protein
MATRSAIGIKQANGKIKAVYCHYDGYPKGVGKTLLENYNSKTLATKLISLGDISSLDEKMSKPKGHSFENRIDGYTVFYGRDRGEKNTKAKIYDDLSDLFSYTNADYVYIFEDGKWLYANHKYKELNQLTSESYAKGGAVSKREIDDFVYEYGVDRKEAEETLTRRKARLSAKENKRLAKLTKKVRTNSQTDSEDIEWDKLVHKYRAWDYKKAAGGSIDTDKSYYRVFKNSSGKDIPVKIVPNPIMNTYDYYVDGGLRGSFKSYEDAEKEVSRENFELYKDGGNLGELDWKAERFLDTIRIANGDIELKDVKVHSTPKGNWAVYWKDRSLMTVQGYLLDDDTIMKYNLEYHTPFEDEFRDGGNIEDLDYQDIYNVLKEKIDESMDDLPVDYENSSSYNGEEVEYRSRDGFMAFTNGGYEASWMEYISNFNGAGKSLPTKQLDEEMQRQVDYNYNWAKEKFIEEYPEIVEELGEENIDYNSLYDADYGDEAEQLSEWEMDFEDDSILCEIGAYYYNPDNYRGIDGEHTVRLFARVNLESPYHRQGNLEDTYDIDITFDSISELETKISEGLEKIISWFEGDFYRDSDTELAINKMANGGRIDLFEDYENIPEEVKEILKEYELEDNSYDVLDELLNRLEAVGYTFSYGLDAEPFGLRPIGVNLNELEGYEDEEDDDKMANGGGVKQKDENYNYIVAQIERNEKALEKTYGTERVEQLQQEIQRLKDKLKNEYGVNKMAKGGGVDEFKVGDKVEFSVPYFEGKFDYKGKIVELRGSYAVVEYYEPLNDLTLKTHLDLSRLSKNKMAKGGGVAKRNYNYIPQEDIDYLMTEYGVKIDGSKLLDGAYAKGKSKAPKVTRTQFEEEDFEFGRGGVTKGQYNIGDKVVLNTKRGKIEALVTKKSDKWTQFDDLTNNKKARWKSTDEVIELMEVLKTQLKKIKEPATTSTSKPAIKSTTSRGKDLAEITLKKLKAIAKKQKAELGLGLNDVKSLMDAGFTSDEIVIVFAGYTTTVNADTEFGDTSSSLIYSDKDYQKQIVKNIADNAKERLFEAGLKYPSFNWGKIISKYDIKLTPKIIEKELPYGTYRYEVYFGKGIAVGHQIGRTEDGEYKSYGEEIGKLDLKKPSAYQKERDYKAGFNGGYWGIVVRKKEDLFSIVDSLLAQKTGYLKDLEMFNNGLGGIGGDEVENEKFATGGKVKNFYNEVGNHLSTLFNGDVELEEFDENKNSRFIRYILPEGEIMNIEQDWKTDGTSTKPVTEIHIYPDTNIRLGRFAIWQNPKEYAQDIFDVIKEKFSKGGGITGKPKIKGKIVDKVKIFNDGPSIDFTDGSSLHSVGLPDGRVKNRFIDKSGNYKNLKILEEYAKGGGVGNYKADISDLVIGNEYAIVDYGMGYWLNDWTYQGKTGPDEYIFTSSKQFDNNKQVFTKDELLEYLEDGAIVEDENVDDFEEFIKMASGGKVSKSKKTTKKKTTKPKMVRQYFEDQPFAYKQGGEINDTWKLASSGKPAMYRFSGRTFPEIRYSEQDKKILGRDDSGRNTSEILETDNISVEGVKSILQRISTPHPSDTTIKEFIKRINQPVSYKQGGNIDENKFNILKSLIENKKYKQAVKYLFNNANTSDFIGADVFSKLKKVKNYNEFQKAYYDSEQLGEYTDQP